MAVGEGVQGGPPRNRSPLARLCLLSPRCERRSLPQERNIPRLALVPAAAGKTPVPVIAKPVRTPAVAIRSPRPNPRPSSFVNPRRGSNGAEPLGREEGSRGTFMEWFPGRFLFPISFPLKEMGSRRSAKSPRPNHRPRRSGQFSERPADSPFVSAIRPLDPSPPAGPFL